MIMHRSPTKKTNHKDEHHPHDDDDENNSVELLLEQGHRPLLVSPRHRTNTVSTPTSASCSTATTSTPLRHHTDQQQQNNPEQFRIYFFTMVFFGAMIVHEVALEAAAVSFGHLDALVSGVNFFQFSFCVLVPLAMRRRGKAPYGEGFPHTYPQLMPYLRLSLLVFCATGLASRSVRYVTYPTKVVFKAVKLIPTMAVATVWQGQRYTRLEYLAAVLLCAGAAGYSYGSGIDTDGDEDGPHTEHWGVILLVTSLLCDAIVPNYQKLLLTQGVSAAQLMINVNTVGTIAVVCYALAANHIAPILETCRHQPQLLWDLICIGVGLSTAVWAYTKLLEATSSVVAVGVSTLRKVATVVISYLLFPKKILALHVLSGMLVLGGLILSSIAKERVVVGKKLCLLSTPSSRRDNL